MPEQDKQAPPPDEQQDDKPQAPEVQISVEETGTLKKKITVTVPAERIGAKQNEMYGELERTAQIPGFRIGRAPRRLVEKRFGKEIAEDVRNAVVGESMGEAIEKSELDTLGQPEIDLEKIDLPEKGELTYDFEVEVKPEFDLPPLEGIEVEKSQIEIDRQRVDQTLEQWRQAHVRYEPTDTPAEQGDLVIAGATISAEGLEPVTKPGLQLRVAPGQIEGLPLVDLADALAGKKAADSVTVEVTAPQAHPDPNWQGKDLTVRIDVSEVRRRVLPELDDAFAAQYGFDSLQQLREQVQRSLESRVHLETQRAMREQICQYLVDQTEFDLPEGLIARHTRDVLKRRYIELLQRGVPREQIDENLTELQTAASEEARRGLKLSFILSKIADERQIQVTPEEINSRVAGIARQYNRRPERLRQELAQDGSLEQVGSTIREEKALDQLLEKAKVTEVSQETDSQTGQGEAKKKTKKKEKKAKKAQKKSKAKAEGGASAKSRKKKASKASKKTK